MFDAGKSRMIALPYGEKKYDDMLSRFHPIPGRYGRTDGRTDRISISILRVCVLKTRDKNCFVTPFYCCVYTALDHRHCSIRQLLNIKEAF